MKQEDFDPKVFEDKGDFDLYRLYEEDVLKGFIHVSICKERANNPKPWVKITDKIKNATGSQDGRVWIPLDGNFSTIYGFPLTFFKNYQEEEFFPVLGPIAILRTFNHFCPDKYVMKFPNDIACKEHRGKTCGLLVRREHGFAMIGPGVNLATCPNPNEVRKQGIKPCCMKNHCDGKLPTPEEWSFECYKNMIQILKECDTPEKVVAVMNEEYNKYENNYNMTINNPNADLKKDGTFWTQKTPNALFKVDHKGMRYQYFSSYYDPIYFKLEGDPDKEKPYHLKYEYLKIEEK